MILCPTTPKGGRLPMVVAFLLLTVLASGCGGNGQVRESEAIPKNHDTSATDSKGFVEGFEIADTGKEDQTSTEYAGSDQGSPFDEDPFASEEEPEVVPDPLETVNRGTFWLNDKLYNWLFKPTVKVYRFFVHEKVREGVANAIQNLSEPVYVANSLLQLKFGNAGRETVRFAINTTLGLGGVSDVAREYGDLPRKTEDMGQTFGVWGAGHGFYLVLPILGPSSLRDGVGTVTDYAFTPLTYMDLTLTERASIKGVDYINEFSLDKDTYEAVVLQSLDPYATIRNGYLQRRKALVER